MFIHNYFIEHNRYLNILGIFFILFILFVFSKNRPKINYKLIINALILQFVLGFLILKTNGGAYVLEAFANGVSKIYLFAGAGADFVFGNLTDSSMPWGFIFGIKVLPIIIFFGALTSILFHLGIIQVCVAAINFVVRPILGTSGAETLCAIANSFLGQTESPLLVRNYLSTMTKSEMFVVMVSGMSTISGAILAVFGLMGVPVKHMLAASVMAIPASILIAKTLYPETEVPVTADGAKIEFKSKSKNIFDAIATGTTDGLWLSINVAAMLIVFISLIFMINFLLSYGSYKINYIFGLSLPSLTLNYVFSKIFYPFSYLLGLTGTDATMGAELLGTKVTVNELVAYSKMVTMDLSERAKSILTYALCGFSNFSCIGIQIGGIGSLVPEKREWLTELGLLTVFASSLANILSALIAGILL